MAIHFTEPEPHSVFPMYRPCPLLGPPEIHLPPPPAAETNGGISLGPLVSQAYNLRLSEKRIQIEEAVAMDVGWEPQMERSSGNPCLDFFFHVLPDSLSQDLIQRLQLAWQHSPLTALKLICLLRSVRGTGKEDKEGFYTAALWLHNNHPKTLACNIAAFAHFGYYKDPFEILYRILEGPHVRKLGQQERRKKQKGKFLTGKFKRQKRPNNQHLEKYESVLNIFGQLKEDNENNTLSRKQRDIFRARKALNKYNLDMDYQFLHNRISDLFAELLKSDIENLNSGRFNKISLAAKWCPTVDSSYDKSTLICESIARKLFTRRSYPEYEGLEEGHYVYRIRDRLRKQILVPLHKALKVPYDRLEQAHYDYSPAKQMPRYRVTTEMLNRPMKSLKTFKSLNQQDSLLYNSGVASNSMSTYEETFLKHDRFKEYPDNVKSEKAKIPLGTLRPHEIIWALNDSDNGEVGDFQWKRMVEDLAKKGKLTNCVALCDVSGSIEGMSTEVSVALAVLISELSEEPWKGKLIAFSKNPSLCKVEGNTLPTKTEFVRKLGCGMMVDFQKVFDQILEVAAEGNLREDQMVKKIFVFSNVKFDRESVTYSNWETDCEVMQRKFREKGYNKVPEIVLWCFRNTSLTPVVAGRQGGVVVVSGCTKNLLTMFFDGDGTVNPEDVMEQAISGEVYDKLIVVD